MANIYYMSPTGSDAAAGTLAAPWKTLATSSTKLAAGDTLYLRGGTYTEHNISWPATPGTAVNPILIQNYSTEVPIFDGGGAAVAFLVAVAPKYTIFDGLTIQNYGLRGGAASGSGIWIGYSGSGTNWATGNIIRNCTFKNIGSSTAQDHSIYFSYGNVNPSVYNCTIINSAGAGIQGAHAPGIQGASFYNNRIFQGHWGILFEDGAKNVNIYNNLIAGCSSDGINSQYNEQDNATYPDTFTINLVARNNIIRGCATGIFMAAGQTNPTFSNNSFFGNTANYSGASGTNDITTDQLLVNYQVNGTGDYHLTSTSPCISAALSTGAPTTDFDGLARPQGAGYDIGPYEFPVVGGGGGDGIAGSPKNWRRFNHLRADGRR